MRAIFSALVDKKHFCDYLPHPLPQKFTIYRGTKHQILIKKSKNIPMNTKFSSQQIPWILKKNKRSNQF